MTHILLLRKLLANFDASVSHTASGTDRPKVEEIYTPEHHAGALDPHAPVVLGARGTGKSFWAGVLGHTETRNSAASAYPRLGLLQTTATFGFIGQEGSGSISKETIDTLVPQGYEEKLGVRLWRTVVLRALLAAVDTNAIAPKVKDLFTKFSDPEDWEYECRRLDDILAKEGRTALILFDALDALSYDHTRLRQLIDPLLEVTWAMRSYNAVRIKLFLRNDQIDRLSLRFIELPKLIAGATRLWWKGTDLYGMLYSRLFDAQETEKPFNEILLHYKFDLPPTAREHRKKWALANNKLQQAHLFSILAGPYMGKSHKKGKTYDWPLKHLSDGRSEVTPRSFLALLINAARYTPTADDVVISPDGIRHGLREASKIRVEQLAREFPWILRALVPLARLQVPCPIENFKERWISTETLNAIKKMHGANKFALPFTPQTSSDEIDDMITTLKDIGVLTERSDGRYDMPDLYRVAARLLKKGGVTPQ